MKFLGAWWMGAGTGRRFLFFFFLFSFFSREMSNGARAFRDPPATHSRPTRDPPATRPRPACDPPADGKYTSICSRSNGHNSLQFRPFSTKIWPNYTKFRDATREATPEAAAPQIRPVSVFSHETPSVTTFFDETWCVKKSSPRRICMQSLGQIRAYAYMHMHICICIYAYALCICILCIMLNFI